MPVRSPAARLLPALRRTAWAADRDSPADGCLVAEFARTRDPDAFAALVARHGGMVFGVCRRVIGDRHAAEDAFQATWLVLVRRADRVRPGEPVANWLYGVAYRTALRARAALFRRRAREQQVDAVPHPAAPTSPCVDLWPVLDAELARLPDKLRRPVVLCDLEGRPQRAAAAELGVPVTTLATRLATARRTLAARLTERGVTLPAAGLAAAVGVDSARAVPPALAAAAVQAAVGAVPAAVVRLSDEVSRMMLFAKLKPAAAGVVIALAAAGFGVQTVAATATADPPVPTLGPTLSDAEFLKRVCLDLRGTPATRVELGYFVADPDAAKRRKVVGWLTEPEAAKVSAFALKRLAADPTRRPPPKTLAEYVIEPPDILQIEAYRRTASQSEQSSGAHGERRPDGANKPDPKNLASLSPDPVYGQYTVRPDGTVSLGHWGAVKVAGRTVREATSAVREAVARKLGADPGEDRLVVLLDVTAPVSKKYYVVSDHTGDDSAWAYPALGSDTVTDALSNIPGLSLAGTVRVWVARRKPDGQGEQILPVDWVGITQHGQTTTNYQLLPGDRVYVRTSRPDGDSDAAFLTRAFRELPAWPTRIEREYFLADTDPKKRDKLLDLMLQDPAVAKAVGPGWKARTLTDQGQPLGITYKYTTHPLAGLVEQLVAARRPADQILDTLTAAALGRLPTDAERAVILAQVAKRSDTAAAWREAVDALCQTPEARTHAERLKDRTGPTGEKK